MLSHVYDCSTGETTIVELDVEAAAVVKAVQSQPPIVVPPSPIEVVLQALRDDPNVKLSPATTAAIDAALVPADSLEVLK